MVSIAVKTQSYHDANFVIPGGTGGGHYDNLQWPPCEHPSGGAGITHFGPDPGYAGK